MNTIKDFKQSVKPFLALLAQNKKAFLILFALYCLAFLTIWRANVYYADDIGRSVTGYGWTSDFNRYSSSALQFFLINMNLKLVDLSPYTQILALLFAALSSFILIYIFTDHTRKLTIFAIAASAFLGLCPYTTACFVYKFDAPCMALAILASVAPFIFYNAKRSTFFLVSTLSLLIMWTSYQAYSGLYIIIAIALALKSLTQKGNHAKTIKQTFFCSLPFFLAALIYKFCLPTIGGYRSVEVFSLAELLPGFFRNLSTVFNLIWSSFNTFWKLLALLFCLAYLASFLIPKIPAKDRLKNLSLATASLVLFIIFSFGAFLFLKDTFYPPRSLCNFSATFSILGLFLASNLSARSLRTKALALPAFLLLYQFFIFDLAFGNALADQWRYSSFRLETLASDLAHLYPDQSTHPNLNLQIQGDIGLSRIAAHVADQYPLLRQLITSETTGLSEHVWGTRRLFYYYHLNFHNAFIGEAERLDCGSMATTLETAYHTIYSTPSTICVVLK